MSDGVGRLEALCSKHLDAAHRDKRGPDGALAERAAVGDAYSVEVPEGVDAALAAGLGIAGLAGWLPFAWRATLIGGAVRCRRVRRA